MDWFKTISDFYNAKLYTIEQVKVFAVKRKITVDEFQQITGQAYIA
jgi:uncharacterized XkdX family phage protein